MHSDQCLRKRRPALDGADLHRLHAIEHSTLRSAAQRPFTWGSAAKARSPIKCRLLCGYDPSGHSTQ